MDSSRERAVDILLDDTQRKSSKARICYAFEDAIVESGAGNHTTVESLLDLYGLKYKAEDLKQAARQFARDIQDDEAWKAYHA